jgi:hypothetical protein
MTLPGRTGAIAKTLLFTVLVPGTVTIYVPRRIFLSRSANDALPIGPLRYLGAALLAAGAAVYLWCAWDVATAAGRPLRSIRREASSNAASTATCAIRCISGFCFSSAERRCFFGPGRC